MAIKRKTTLKNKRYVHKTWAEITAERLNLTPQLIMGGASGQ